ncbi:ABC transporter substrate-binding protein [Sciscionella marina]|uniref:ABC transporter substrate-binding protein n=1 Tax=Sciscionella marina TaxID=508770 RepID=UPI0003651442|nr:sugar ABC transporter substrate-binding protein [Sciscionella marina]
MDRFLRGLCCAFVIVLLAGCASGAGREALRVWLLTANNESIGHGYAALLADFQRRFPGVRVELDQLPYQEYQDKLVLAMQGGTGPDVLELDQINTPQFAAAGLIEPVGQFLAHSPELARRNYFPGAWDSNRWHGRLWGLPFNADVWERLFYNTALFRAAGLDPGRPPRTWPQWLDAARRIAALPGKSGIGLIGCRDEASSVLTDSLLYSAGGSVLHGDRVTFDSEPARRAYRMFARLAEYAPAGLAGACDTDSLAQFTAGQTGMVLAGGWQEATIGKSARFPWRVARPPGPEGGRFVGALGGYNLAINAASTQRRNAFEFAKLATTSVRHQIACNDSVPALREAGSRYVRASRSAPEDMLSLLAQGEPRAVTPVYSKVSRAQQDAVQSILDGEPVGSAVATAAGQMHEAIGRQ